MQYTLKSLSEQNQAFIAAHGTLQQYDVEKANTFSELILRTRDAARPVTGDIVRFTNESGIVYAHAHVNHIDGEMARICEHASVFVQYSYRSGLPEDLSDVKRCQTTNGEGGAENLDHALAMSASGGAWQKIPVADMKLTGTSESVFWFFGHCGPRQNGAVYFSAPVHVWEYSENTEPFTSEERNAWFLHYIRGQEAEYRYDAYGLSPDRFGYTNAWRSKEDLQAWLRTFRAQQSASGLVWTCKEELHHLSPQAYEALDAVEDTTCMNGLRRCKRIWDDAKSTVHTYIVWYWDDGSMNGRELADRSAWQNEAIAKYALPGRSIDDECSFARQELADGRAKPMKISFS